jgi:polar amino acid transport system substrate-binding protein
MKTPFSQCLLGAVAALALAGSAKAAELSVCIDTASAAAPRDQAAAEAAAQRQNLTLAVHHFDGSGDDEGFSLKEFKALLAHDCDLVMGYPIDSTGGQPPSGLSVTAPYDQTGYTLVTADPLPSTGLADLPEGTEVAVTYGAVPNLYFVTHHNVSSDIHLSEDDTLAALVSGKVRAAMLWQPTIAVYLAAHETAPFSYHALAEPHARYNIVALYAPKGAEAAAQFQAGMAAPKKSGMNEAPALRHFGARRFVQLAADLTGEGGNGAVPALYTDAQAKQGTQKYADNCAQCHGDALQGQSGPALKGPLFASVKSAFSVGDILTFMSINMPATQPGSLSHDDYVQIMAYVLAQNGYPAGQAALTFDGGSASKVPLLYHGK